MGGASHKTLLYRGPRPVSLKICVVVLIFFARGRMLHWGGGGCGDPASEVPRQGRGGRLPGSGTARGAFVGGTGGRGGSRSRSASFWYPGAHGEAPGRRRPRSIEGHRSLARGVGGRAPMM